MSVGGKKPVAPDATLTDRQKKWFASVRASLVRDTGKSLDEWAEIARACPHTAPRQRALWLLQNHGLGANRAAQVLRAAFPSGAGWDDPETLLSALWTHENGRAIYDKLAALVRASCPEAVIGPRKTFVGFSRKVQFAAVLPTRGGGAELGLPLTLATSARLQPPRKRPWADRHISALTLTAPRDVDREVKRLILLAWERG